MATNVGGSNRIGQSVIAVLAGLVSIVVLQLGTDFLLRLIHVFPGLDEEISSADYLVMIIYRVIYAVGGGYLTAMLAPHAPMRHALILGGIGFVVSLLGLFVAIIMPIPGGQLWYPAALVVTALPSTWAGGRLYIGGNKAL